MDWIPLINGDCVVFWYTTIKSPTSHKNIEICVLILFPQDNFGDVNAVIEEKIELHLRRSKSAICI